VNTVRYLRILDSRIETYLMALAGSRTLGIEHKPWRGNWGFRIPCSRRLKVESLQRHRRPKFPVHAQIPPALPMM